MSRPYLSVVVTARNDDHGGGFLRRMQIFVNGLAALSNRKRLRTELIVVEWNPPPDRPPLSQALKWPDEGGYCTVRLIEVPREIHMSYTHSERLGLYQWIAKNVGIRRARGDFILATNVDILFSEELISWLASSNLKSSHVYNLVRYDVPQDVPLEASIEEQLRYCKENTFRINAREGSYNLMTGRYSPSFSGFHYTLTGWYLYASGDFTLMARQDWWRLRGYPEFDTYSLHIDNLILLVAYHAGLRQIILPFPIYHIDHSFSATLERTDEFKRMGATMLDIQTMEEWAREMNRNGLPILFNGEDWGLASEDLKEERIARAGWDRTPVLKERPSKKRNPDPFMSVVVAVREGGEPLERTLKSLRDQDVSPSEYEMVLTGRRSLLATFKEWENVRCVPEDSDNPSRLWKKGVEGSRGEVVLFLEEGSVAERGLLAEHIRFHRRNPPKKRGLLSLWGQEEFGMVGVKEEDPALKGLEDGRVLPWWFFRCGNLSLRRDLILRYGGFDETLGGAGDIELGYRLSRYNLRLIFNSRAKVRGGISLSPQDLPERDLLLFREKYPGEREVERWCRDVAGVEDPGREEVTRIKKMVFQNKLCNRAGDQGEKTILIISERLPIYDNSPEEERFFQMIETLAERHRVILLVRSYEARGRYVEALRRRGVCVCYDMEIWRKFALVESPILYHPTAITDIEDILTGVNCDLIILRPVDSLTSYLLPIRELSPQSLVAFYLDRELEDPALYGLVDLMITRDRPIPVEGAPVFHLPSDRAMLRDALLHFIDALPDPGRAFQKRLAPLGTRRKELLLLFLVEEGCDVEAMGSAIERAYEASSRDLTDIAIALHGGDRRLWKLEGKGPFSMKYRKMEEVSAFLRRALEGYDHVAIARDGIFLSSCWDRVALEHLEKDRELGILIPSVDRTSGDLYEFEEGVSERREGQEAYLDHPMERDPAFVVIRGSILKDCPYQGIPELIRRGGGGYRVAKARDLVIWKPAEGRKREHLLFRHPENRLVSVVVPSSGDVERLDASLRSLYRQEGIDPGLMEVIVAFHGEDLTPPPFNPPPGLDVRSLHNPSPDRVSSMNEGVKEACGRYILFLEEGDVAHPSMVKEHLNAHSKGEDAVVCGAILHPPHQGSPFMRFLMENPWIQKIPYYSFNYRELADVRELPFFLFHLSNTSLKRETFQSAGPLREGLDHGWEGTEFAVRLTLNGTRLLYRREAIAEVHREITLAPFLERQLAVGRQYALEAIKHPGIWDLEDVKRACVEHILGKEEVIEAAWEFSQRLETMSEVERERFVFAGIPLLDRCYILLSNHWFARGIDGVLKEVYGEKWLDRFIEERGLEKDRVVQENLAFRWLLEALFEAGRGNMDGFIQGMEKALRLFPSNPEFYYVLGHHYLDTGRCGSAEEMFERSIEWSRRRRLEPWRVLPSQDEVMYHLYLALSRIAQGRYREAIGAIEDFLSDMKIIPIEKEVLLYRTLGLCYGKAGDERKALFCFQEVERLSRKVEEGDCPLSHNTPFHEEREGITP